MSRWNCGDCIGRGSYGDVHKGVDKVTGQQVALKIINLEDVEDDIEDIHNEIQMLAGCRCDNITEYYGSELRPNSTELIIAMELMACSVADLVHGVPLDEPSLAYVTRELLNALHYLHGEHRIHRDVKAANILLSNGGAVKVSDFGVSGQLSGTMGYRRRTFVGTPFWMAPEVIEASDEGYSERADIWSLGITVIEMATGAPPHSSLPPLRVLFLIPKEAPPRLEGDKFSQQLKDFVALCLQKDPEARPAVAELLTHPWIASAPARAPTTLLASIMECMQRKKPLPSRRDTTEGFLQGTLPGWDFGTRKGGRPGLGNGRDTIKGVGPAADRYTTLKSLTAAMGGTVKSSAHPGSDIRPLRDLTQQMAAEAGGTVRAVNPPDAHINGGPAAAAGRTLVGGTPTRSDGGAGTGTTSATSSAGQGVVNMMTWTSKQPGASGSSSARPSDGGQIISGGGAVPRGAPNTRYTQSAAPAHSGDTSEDSYNTVRVAGQGREDKYGTIQSRPPPSDSPVPASTSMRRAGNLQVEISNPASASTDTVIPVGCSESAAVLGQVLLPSLANLARSSSGSVDGGAANGDALGHLTAGLQAQLQQLERAAPGTSAALLQELLVKLATSGDPSLGPSKAAAASLLGRAPPSGSGGVYGSREGGVQNSQSSGGGAAGLLPTRKVGGLGPLGEFLLGQWQGEVAHEAVLLARGQKL